MTEPPDPDPILEQASDLFDEGRTSADPAVEARIAELALARALIRDVAPPSDAVRERLVSAALATPHLVSTRRPARRPVAIGALVTAAAAAVAVVVVLGRSSNPAPSASGHRDASVVSTAAPTPGAARAPAASASAGAIPIEGPAASANAGVTVTAPTTASAATTTASASSGGAGPLATAAAPPPAPSPATASSPSEILALYRALAAAPRPTAAPPPGTCAVDGAFYGPVRYGGVIGQLWLVTNGSGGRRLEVLATADCRSLGEVEVP